jgi:hypothetical protein
LTLTLIVRLVSLLVNRPARRYRDMLKLSFIVAANVQNNAAS